MIEIEEDEDVVFEGTALYEHLVLNGFQSELELTNQPHGISTIGKKYSLEENNTRTELQKENINTKLLSDYKRLQHGFTIKMFKSELLVLEDEEFMQTFFVLENKAKETPKLKTMSSSLKILVPLSASALSFFHLKNFLKTSWVEWRAPTAALSVSVAVAGLWRLLYHARDSDQGNMDNMALVLETMAELKDVVNKCLTFLKGMELVGKYYRQPTTFLTLRETLQKTTLSSLEAVRAGTIKLMATCPLQPAYDAPSHYLAGQNLANFGLQSVNEGSAGEELNTSKLRDVVNIHLVMQSEFLRRLALCLSPDLRSDSRSLALGQDLGHMSHTCEDIRLQLDTNCHQLRLCLRYNQALGCGDNTGNMSKVNKIPSSCSDLHPSLKSGCLHLQNCLLKLREIETSDLDNENSSGLPDIKENLQEVMNELTVCQEAVQESFEIVSNILNPESKICKIQREIVDSTKDEQDGHITLITEGKEIERYDEVFEAFIKASDLTILDHDDKEDIQEVKVKLKESKQTKKVLRELKSVLVGKQLEWKVREEKALARQNGDNLSIETKTEDVKNESLELQQKMKADRYSLSSSESSECDSDHNDSQDDCPRDKSFKVGHKLLNNQNMFTRPKRPKRSTKSSTKVIVSPCESDETKLPSVIDNVITDREGTLRTLNTQPIGFDNRLATEAVRLRLSTLSQVGVGEECFGDSSAEES